MHLHQTNVQYSRLNLKGLMAGFVNPIQFSRSYCIYYLHVCVNNSYL